MSIGGISCASWNVRNILCFQHCVFLIASGDSALKRYFSYFGESGIGARWAPFGVPWASRGRCLGASMAPRWRSGRRQAPLWLSSGDPFSHGEIQGLSYPRPSHLELLVPDPGLQPRFLDGQIPGCRHPCWNGCFSINFLLRIEDLRA